MPPQLPAYVDYGGLATCPSPVNCTNSTLYAFFLDAELSRMEELCSRVFTKPSEREVHVRPFVGLVMVTFGSVEKIQPQLKPWSQMGYATERQVAYWIPVLVRRGLAMQIGWFVPYMWVDNPLSLAGGREIYGFNKNWGWISLPEDGTPGRFTLEAYGGNYGGEQRAGRHPLLRVTAANGALTNGDKRWRGLREVLAAAQGALMDPGVQTIEDFEPELRGGLFDAVLNLGGPPQFYLRQFRSIEDGRRAYPLQITSSGVTVKKIEVSDLQSTFAFELEHLDSHPVAKELGVKEKQSTRRAFVMQMDFVLETGKVLWPT